MRRLEHFPDHGSRSTIARGPHRIEGCVGLIGRDNAYHLAFIRNLEHVVAQQLAGTHHLFGNRDIGLPDLHVAT